MYAFGMASIFNEITLYFEYKVKPRKKIKLRFYILIAQKYAQKQNHGYSTT